MFSNKPIKGSTTKLSNNRYEKFDGLKKSIQLQIESANSSLDVTSKDSGRLRSQLPNVVIKGESTIDSHKDLKDDDELQEIFMHIKQR